MVGVQINPVSGLPSGFQVVLVNLHPICVLLILELTHVISILQIGPPPFCLRPCGR